MESKAIRQYAGVFTALIAYYIIHEGAHLLYAVVIGVFKAINIMSIFGVQIDIYREQMTDTQLGLFCIAGPVATFIAAWVCIVSSKYISLRQSKMAKAIGYYVTMTFMFLDPIYLSVVYRYVGGGDMNGIVFLMPETAACILFGVIFVFHLLVFVKYVYPVYKKGFAA